MDSTPAEHKPYTLYKSDSAGQYPPRGSRLRRLERRRRRHGLLIATLAVIGVAAAAVAAGGWGATSFGWATANTRQPSGASGAGLASLAGSASGSPAPTASAVATGDPSPAATVSPEPLSITVTGGGDVIGDRAVRTVLAQQGAGLFEDIAPIFAESDFGFVNLETPLTTGGEPQAWKDVVLKGDPRLAAAMAESGINVVTLANNHAGDQGDTGLLETLRHCQQNGIAVVGAGKNLAGAQRGAILKSDGANAAFLGFTDVLPLGYAATTMSPGTSPGRSDIGAVTRAIQTAAAKADFTFVAWHWNLEFTTAPSSLESGEGRAAIDAGADVVFAHHPHVLQGVEAYHGGLICYSLGDLVFDNCTGPMAQTILVTTKVSRTEIEATLTPVQIASSGQPFVATGANGLSILTRVKTCSAALGTIVRISGGQGHVTVRR